MSTESQTPQPDPGPALPHGWTLARPTAADVPRLTALRARHQERARGWASTSQEELLAQVVGRGREFRAHRVIRDGAGEIVAWANVQDRAAQRVNVDVWVDEALVASDAATADALAAALFAWAEDEAREIAAGRGVALTQLDSSPYTGDEATHRWLCAAGYDRTRTWLHMARPVSPEEAEEGVLPGPREGVTIRRVGYEQHGRLPDEDDLRAVHHVLEESFRDHFNSHHEPFLEFVARLREDPGHRWDHWWLAEVTGVEQGEHDRSPGTPLTAGAVVASAMAGDDGEPDGTYIEYIGVNRRARGRGVAKGLIHAVIRDAAERGRTHVDLEVDADSPTGADGLYTAMGWVTKYRTESWHRVISTTDR